MGLKPLVIGYAVCTAISIPSDFIAFCLILSLSEMEIMSKKEMNGSMSDYTQAMLMAETVRGAIMVLALLNGVFWYTLYSWNTFANTFKSRLPELLIDNVTEL